MKMCMTLTRCNVRRIVASVYPWKYGIHHTLKLALKEHKARLVFWFQLIELMDCGMEEEGMFQDNTETVYVGKNSTCVTATIDLRLIHAVFFDRGLNSRNVGRNSSSPGLVLPLPLVKKGFGNAVQIRVIVTPGVGQDLGILISDARPNCSKEKLRLHFIQRKTKGFHYLKQSQSMQIVHH
jgi:hypothetical protein